MVPPKSVYLPISKLHSILALANLLAHNNKSQICYCGQISLQSAAVNCSFSDTFGGYHLFCWRWYFIFYLELLFLPMYREINQFNQQIRVLNSLDQNISKRERERESERKRERERERERESQWIQYCFSR